MMDLGFLQGWGGGGGSMSPPIRFVCTDFVHFLILEV